MQTLCIDIGGTGIKAIVLDAAGQPRGERLRVLTPRPATPEAVLAAMEEPLAGLGEFDRVAVGFPGVVVDGVTRTAPNLDPAWQGFPLAARLTERTGKPVRVANDAGVQGLAVIEGTGVELVLTLGTGMGFALYTSGHYVPNIEMGHHIFRGRRTYEDRVGEPARARVGNKRWRRRVLQVIAALAPVFNYRVLYIGGGNARLLDPAELPENVRVVDNVAGLLGGLKLWA
ncbi:MAG: ROK family protein [Nannocystis sp.]|nr:ROK family protein [Nannocystis sp.]MBA3549086.1 ROK family protein [Nannocystis sp.]